MKYQAISATASRPSLPNDLRNEFIAHGWQSPNGMGPNEMGTNEMGPNGMGPNGMGPNEMGTNGMGPNGMGPNGIDTNGMGPNGIDTTFVFQHSNPYDEFRINFLAYNKVEVTVPIPFKADTVLYKNTFDCKNMASVVDYIKIHLANYHNNTVRLLA